MIFFCIAKLMLGSSFLHAWTKISVKLITIKKHTLFPKDRQKGFVSVPTNNLFALRSLALSGGSLCPRINI